MPRTRRLFLAALPVALVAGLSLALLRPWQPASSTAEPLPPAITDNTDALASFESLRFQATWGGYEPPYQNVRHLITVDDQGRFTVDYIASWHQRLVYDGTTLTFYNGVPGHDAQTGPTLDHVALLWEDLWPELRSGFANSEWILVDMHEEGFAAHRADNDWYRLVLPFAWADEVDVYVCLYPPTSKIESIKFRSPDDQKSIGIFNIQWNPTLEAQAFSGVVPDKVHRTNDPPEYPVQ